MLNFVGPGPIDLLISAVQSVWGLYARTTGSHIRIEISENDRQRILALEDQRALICPNHADHADPMVVFGLSAKCKQHFAYLTAREIFKRYPSPSALWLRALGCYSVVRAAADIESYRTSLELLFENRAKIVIFPEGEISHQNMRVSKLEDGPELVAISVALKLAKRKQDEPVWIIPVGLLYRYEKSLSESATSLLERLEQSLLVKPDCACVPHRLKACFEALMKKLVDLDGNVKTETKFEPLKTHVVSKIISTSPYAELAHIASSAPSLESIHKLKNLLNEIRFRGSGKISEPHRKFYRQLKTITNLHAIDEHSFDHSLTQEEAAELLFVLEEEVLRTQSIHCDRVCYVAVGEAIDVREFLTTFANDKSEAVQQCKTRVGDAIRTTVISLAAQHPSNLLFPICGNS
jgi:1-acyl-sn-glycerol-3-phosphate acyltransferase